MKLLVSIVLCLCLSVLEVRGDAFQECSDITEKKFIASSESCAHYIFCDGDESYEGDCVEDEYFSEEFQMCDFMDNVSCRNVSSESDSSIVANQTSSSESTATSATATTVSENSTLATASTVLQNSTLPTVIIESQNTTTQIVMVASESTMAQNRPSTTSATTTTASSSITEVDGATPISTIVSTTCPVIDDPKRLVFLSNEKSCSSFFVCLSGERLAMQCSSKLHFNPQTGKCDYPENVKCLLGFSNAREQCQSDIVDVFPHPRKCNYYYVCQNGYLLLNQCPFFYGWDYEKRSCVEIAKATCYDNAKRF